MNKQKKRFIAGAQCPHCKEQDSLRWWIENNIEVVECVDCDYTEQRSPKSIEESEHKTQDMIGIFKPD